MTNPTKLLQDVKLMTGVVEVGLFCDMAKAAYFGNDDGSITSKVLSSGGQVEVKEGQKFQVDVAPSVA